jgi:hypothetical protein
MPSTVLVKDVLWRAAVLLMDSAPQWVRYPEQELCAWLDDGQMALAKFVPSACARIDAIKLAAGSRQSIDKVLSTDIKPGDGSTPATVFGLELLDIVRDMGTDGVTVGNVIRRAERAGLDAAVPDWHKRVADVATCYHYDPRFPAAFYVSPPLKARRWVELAWCVAPKATLFGAVGSERYAIGGSDTTTIQVGDEHTDDLVNYIVARANMAPNEWADAQKGAAFSSAFLNSVNARIAALTGNNPNLRVLPFAPDIGRAAQ